MPKKSKSPADAKMPKQRLAVVISGELVEKARDAVYWTPGLTLASITERALEAELKKLEKQRGEPIPPREANLRAGRPVK
jgi:hypothetical protein